MASSGPASVSQLIKAYPSARRPRPKREERAIPLRFEIPTPAATGPAMDGTRPLLIFDSGVGGLSVLGAIREALPSASLVYAADSAGFPYGTKTEAEIQV